MLHAAPEHLDALIRTVGSPLVSLTPITALPGRQPARTFRLEFADGRVLKGRQLESEAQAARIRSLTALAGSDFSQVIAREHDTVLEAWIAGMPLAPGAGGNVALARRSGGILGRLHTRVAPPGFPARGVAWAIDEVEGYLREAAALGALTPRIVLDV